MVFSSVIEPALLRKILQRVYNEEPQIENFYFESFEEYCSTVLENQARNPRIKASMINFIFEYVEFEPSKFNRKLMSLLRENKTVYENRRKKYLYDYIQQLKYDDVQCCSSSELFKNIIEIPDQELRNELFIDLLGQDIDSKAAHFIFVEIVNNKHYRCDNEFILRAFEAYFILNKGVERELDFYLKSSGSSLNISEELCEFIINKTDNYMLLAFMFEYLRFTHIRVDILPDLFKKLIIKAMKNSPETFEVFVGRFKGPTMKKIIEENRTELENAVLEKKINRVAPIMIAHRKVLSMKRKMMRPREDVIQALEASGDKKQ